MEFTRLPRFKRFPAVTNIRLTERDREILRLVHRHRFLRSPQIISLVGGSPQHLLRRLASLFHHGYLERPRAQLDYYRDGGSHHMVYGLGNKGGTLLKRELGIPSRRVSWGEKNRGVGRMFLEHALLVSDIMVAVELSCRERAIRFRTEKELELPVKRQPFQWKVKIDGRVKLGVVPDRMFGLEFTDADGRNQRVVFFLEADRGTMPVVRRNLSQTSFRRKLLAYEATWTQDLHRTQLGIHRFRVLTVTESVSRLKSLVEACSELKRGHGPFLFADRTILENIFAEAWQTGRPGEKSAILDLPGTARLPA